MPIATFLDSSFDPETRRVMGVAYEMTRAAFQLRRRETIDDELVANKIIELAKAGETNPDRLCERVLSYLQQHLSSRDPQANNHAQRSHEMQMTET
jgi:hypothetical protein